MILIIKMMEKTITKDANKKTLYLPLKKQWYEMIEREAENKRRCLHISVKQPYALFLFFTMNEKNLARLG